MEKLEKDFEESFMKALKGLPRSYWPTKLESVSSRGHPDRVGCVAGRYIALEFKRSLKEMLRGSPRQKLQQHVLDKIQMCEGYAVFVCPQNADQIYDKLYRMAHGYK